jgi:hypothetical protein
MNSVAAKPKWKTTEFWVQVIAFLATILGITADKIPPVWGEILLAAQAGFYTWSRLAAKRIAEDAQVKSELAATLEVREAKGLDEQVHEAVAVATEPLVNGINEVQELVKAWADKPPIVNIGNAKGDPNHS